VSKSYLKNSRICINTNGGSEKSIRAYTKPAPKMIRLSLNQAKHEFNIVKNTKNNITLKKPKYRTRKNRKEKKITLTKNLRDMPIKIVVKKL